MGNMLGSEAEPEEPPCCASGQSGSAPQRSVGGALPPPLDTPVMPELLIDGWSADRDGPPRSALLTDGQVLELNAKVGAPGSWELLFSSQRHGKSYARMLKESCHRGASLVVVREEGPEGRVFGGYADVSWSEGAVFFGGTRCFLFHIPVAAGAGAGAAEPEPEPAASSSSPGVVVLHRTMGRDKSKYTSNPPLLVSSDLF